MAQINSPKSFDKQTLDPTFLKQGEPLIDYMNQQFDQLNRALIQQLTLGENVRGQKMTLSCFHGQSISVSPTSSVSDLVVLGCSGNDAVRGVARTQTTDGLLSLTFYFQNPVPVLSRSVSYSAPFASYELKGVGGVTIGDKVTFTGHKDQNFNGTFICQYLSPDKSRMTVFNPSVSGNLSEDTYVGSSEVARMVTLYLFF